MPIVPAEKVHRISIIFNFHVLQRERENFVVVMIRLRMAVSCVRRITLFSIQISQCLDVESFACYLRGPSRASCQFSRIIYKIQFNLELSQIRSEKMFVLRKSEKNLHLVLLLGSISEISLLLISNDLISYYMCFPC